MGSTGLPREDFVSISPDSGTGGFPCCGSGPAHPGLCAVLKRLIWQWLNDRTWARPVRAPVAAYIAWQTRKEWLNLPPSGNWWAGSSDLGRLAVGGCDAGAELFLGAPPS